MNPSRSILAVVAAYVSSVRELLRYGIELEIPSVWDLAMYFAPILLIVLGIIAVVVAVLVRHARKYD